MKQVTTLRSGDNRRGRQNRLASSLMLSICIGFASTAQALFHEKVFNDVGNWADQAVKDVKKDGESAATTVQETAQNTVATVTKSGENLVGTIVETGDTSINAVAKFSDSAIEAASHHAQDGYNDASKLAQDTLNTVQEGVEEAALAVYGPVAEAYLQQVRGPLDGFGGAWAKLLAEKPTEFNELKVAIQNGDSSAIGAALPKVFRTIGRYAGFDAIIKDFEDKNAGSLLLIVSGGGGVGVSGNIDFGIAIDIDAVPLLINGQIEQLNGPIASLFTAAGVQIGPAAGGGVDFVVGYHTANPNGVFGPGLDISLEIKAGAGGGFGIGFDLSQAPPQIVTASVSVGAGLEVQASAGPSYAFVLGQLCSNWTFREFSAQCPKSTTIANWSWENLPGKAKDIGVGSDGSTWVINTNAGTGGYGIARWNGSKWTGIGGAAIRLAVDPQGNPWVVNSSDKIYHWTGSRWDAISGAAKDIGVGADGSVWVIGTNAVEGGYGIHHWQDGKWSSIPGGAVRIAVDKNGKPWVVNASGTIHRWTGNGWNQLPGGAKDIGVGANGTVWVTSNTINSDGNRNLYWWDGSGAWQKAPGSAVNVAVGPSGKPWVIRNGGAINVSKQPPSGGI